MTATQWNSFKPTISDWQCPITKNIPSGEWEFPFTSSPTNSDSSTLILQPTDCTSPSTVHSTLITNECRSTNQTSEGLSKRPYAKLPLVPEDGPFIARPNEWACPITKKLPSGESKLWFVSSLNENVLKSSPNINKTTTDVESPSHVNSISTECVCPPTENSLPAQTGYHSTEHSILIENDSNIENDSLLSLKSSSPSKCEFECSRKKSRVSELKCIKTNTIPQTELKSACSKKSPGIECKCSYTKLPLVYCECHYLNKSAPPTKSHSRKKPQNVKFECDSSKVPIDESEYLSTIRSPDIANCEIPRANNLLDDNNDPDSFTRTFEVPRWECPININPSLDEWESMSPLSAREKFYLSTEKSKLVVREHPSTSKPQHSEYEYPQYPDNGNEAETWRLALLEIAAEVKRFFCTSVLKKHNTPVIKNEDLTTTIRNQKRQLQSKELEISKLKKDIRKACIIAKTIVTTKEEVIKSLKLEIDCIKKEANFVQDKLNCNDEIVKRISVENQLLSDKLDNLTNFINLGYRELQKINGEIKDDVPVTIQLRNIIVSCGKYYADYFNERQKLYQSSQKNLFLSNKIKALENLLQNNLCEVTEVRHKIFKLTNENKSLKVKIRKLIENNNNNKRDHYTEETVQETPWTDIQRDIRRIKDELSGVKLTLRTYPKYRRNDVLKNICETGGDPRSRTSIVNTLMRDQNDMLQQLKKISRELLSETNVNYVTCTHKISSNSKVRYRYSIPKPFNENTSVFGYPMSVNNVVHGSSEINTHMSPSLPTIKFYDQEEDDKLDESFSKTSNTVVLYETNENIDDKSTLCGISSETNELIFGSVAYKIKTFENISEDV